MSIFGQVWLWSLAAFLVGVLLTWLLLVRPAQARTRALERRLEAALAAPAPEPAAPSSRFFEPELEEERYSPSSEPEPHAAAAEPEPLAGQFEPRSEPPERLWVEPDQLERFPSEPEPEPEPAVGQSGQSGAPWFRNGEAGDEEPTEQAETPAPEFAGLSSVLEPDLTPGAATTSVLRPADEEPIEDKGSEHGTLFGPDDPAPPEFAAPEPPVYAFGGAEAPGIDESATETTQVLPRRQPRQAGRDGSAQPEPPLMRPIERREPVAPDEGGRSGSLFEPSVRRGAQAAAVDTAAPTPPPARDGKPESTVPPGPFGPGSGMPRPGGGRPSEDFAVKASVTALRYCTEDSPHYARMVAEVWFRTVADAERVGFRPLA
jgi:hypothetical protein